jgi:hypothetical protein
MKKTVTLKSIVLYIILSSFLLYVSLRNECVYFSCGMMSKTLRLNFFSFHEFTYHFHVPSDPTGQAALCRDGQITLAFGRPNCYSPDHMDTSYCAPVIG